MSDTYLVVSAIHIFDWITRTPELKYVRGASKALRDHTARDRIQPRFGWEWPDDAGDVDGVVAFRLPAEQSAGPAADRVASYLSGVLPAVEWEAWWVEADDYTSAYLEYEAATRNGFSGSRQVGHRLYLPVALEPPLAQTCPTCRKELAEPPHSDAGEDPEDDAVEAGPASASDAAAPGKSAPPALGADCRVRDVTQRAEKRDLPVATRKRRPRDFETLATRGGLGAAEQALPGRRRSRNHLATLHADGNAVGDLMYLLTRVADEKPDWASLRKRMPAALDAATRAALTRAEAAVSRDAAVDGAIRHFAGGDDVMVSVAAPVAWDFAMVLASAFPTILKTELFGRSYEAAVSQLPTDLRQTMKRVSLGIGITFADSSYPFADSRRRAFDAMKQAKKKVSGTTGVVAWFDLTAEESLDQKRYVVLDRLLVDRRSSGGLLHLPAATRAAVAAVLRDFGADKQVVIDELDRLAKRSEQVIDLTVPPLEAQTGLIQVLKNDLSRARWWPSTEIPEELRP